jgi:hypothetical protein
MRFAFLAFVALLLLGYSSAQISPGPLSRAHQSLEGATQCTSCHKFGGEAILKCIDCHTEIAERLTFRKGLHATYGMKAGSSQELRALQLRTQWARLSQGSLLLLVEAGFSLRRWNENAVGSDKFGIGNLRPKLDTLHP